MRKTLLYMCLAMFIFLLSSQSAMVVDKVGTNNYQEECLNEGCNNEEVRELHVMYKEECIKEGCNKEELIELGGTPSGALSMLQHFRNLGFTVRDKDFMNLQCSAVGSETKCMVFFLMCKDIWQGPDGIHKSTWYVCGGCFFG